MSKTTEFFCRLPRSVDLIHDYEDITPTPKAAEECRAALYSPNGEYFAYTQPNEVVVINTKSKAQLYHRIQFQEVFDIYFSPNGTFLCLWCKPIQINREDGTWNNNLKVFNLKTKSVIVEWSQKHQNGWKPQFTQDEKLLAKNFANNKEIHFYEINADSDELINIAQPSYKYKVSDPKAPFQNFQLSPGLNPSVAIFIPEVSGKPASVLIYNVPNFNQPTCSKNFFKAERCQLKWNSLGTALLALASTDHDTSNKSYYGETNLYLLGIAGSYDSRIDLRREGPIHDITWSPSAREFAVSYGFMPSETTFFDARGNAIHSLPTAPRNTILYSPHARFVLVAGFGNLQGTVDVYDRQNKFTKVVTFEATNTSICEWSPCGRFILTATTSPRLRVDNGCKIWHASGQLVYLKEYQELYSIGWKPQSISEFPPLKQLEPAPAAHESAKEFLAKRAAASATAAKKPAGAYRPPHARGTASPSTATSLYQKELENNFKQQQLQQRNGINPSSGRARVVPGAAPVEPKESKTALKNRKKREAKKQQEGSPAPEQNTIVAPVPVAAAAAPIVPGAAPTGGTVVGGVASLEEKKIRSLLKKLRAIETLKMKQASGEPLEDTQVSKIKKEEDIRKELYALGWSD
ncbi:eukaryotic translation initiation factor eIF2A-domain-containing protein [Scheffersomyces xylosifermentans]|uniref:eukaryotic translation initiation factor eIF2A-domain-containing protein n=1 Tax=Scheffersomyces xylosifermentans TaxID=1304137 RepID=UPI00315D7EF6